MTGRADDHGAEDVTTPDLCTTDRAVLEVLIRQNGRVTGRNTILRMAGIDHVGPRRCDSAIVNIRRILGADSVVTVRRRGWMMTPEAAERAASLFGRSDGARSVA